MPDHVRVAEQNERTYVQKLNSEHDSGENGRGSREEQEMISVKFGGSVKDFAEGHRPELVVHINSCASDLPCACGLSSGGIIIRSPLQRLYSSSPRREGVISNFSVGRYDVKSKTFSINPGLNKYAVSTAIL